MAPFRMGLVGAGRMGRTHLRALAGSDILRVVAVADPLESARAAVAAPDISVHADLATMLRAGNLDGVLIASSSDTHLAAIGELAAVGMPILCEKPCGLSSRQGKEAAALAAAAGVPLQVAYWRRFVPSLKKLKARIVAGELGDLYLAACYQWDEQPPAPSFRTRSGGIFMDMAVHEFDQIRWLSGQEIGTLHAVAARTLSDAPVPGDAESAQVLCVLSGGATGLVSLGRRFPLGDVCKVEVFGTKNAEECRFLWPPSAEQAFLGALRLQAESFVRWVGGADAEGASALDAVAALDAAERASRIVQNGREDADARVA
ncbi:MAG TPA: Gfo/Idh/MocA family oxidoreductase [Candidatus Acidoferrum sp.]|nr:Gfo/Idh/MocA family oxidoreductase [Candidatus Acidoferrum sp.]